MNKRTTQPYNNRYYKRIASGGLSAAIKGYPVVAGADVLCNCVGYANSRFNEIINDPDLKTIYKPFKYQLVCNAENFIEDAKRKGLTISNTPTVGGIMVWRKGATLSGSDGAGHVAVVEEIYSDGSILTSESGYGGFAFKLIKRTNSNGRWGQGNLYFFRGCIVNPAVGKGEPIPAPKLDVDGQGGPSTVMRLQEYFNTIPDGYISGQLENSHKKYFPSFNAVKYGKGGSNVVRKLQSWLGVSQDGLIGPATVKAWQKKLKATGYYTGSIDGSFGSGSMKALQEFLNNDGKVKATPSAPAAPKPSTPSAATKTNAEKINQKAIDFAWVAGTPEKIYKYPSGNPTPAFKEAWKKYFPKKKINCGCHQYVMLVLKACGYPTMDISSWTKILAYLKKNFTEIKVNYTQAQLKAGDIRVHKNSSGGYHIWIIAKDPNGKMVRKEANQVGDKRYAHTNTNNGGNTKKHKADWLFRAK